MRVIPGLISFSIVLLLVGLLSMQWGSTPPLGSFLSPQHGFWQNAEPVDLDLSQSLTLEGLHDSARICFDDRMVPHVFTTNDADAYFLQGWLHAKFRLWQMEFQVYAAAGRISELIGRKALNFDREKRRLGMVYAAEHALQAIESDSISKTLCDSYTAGVNAYISSLKESELPIEYKLLNYRPERWTNLKSALFLKNMALELSGYETDFENTNARNAFGILDYEKMFPLTQDSLDPIIPKGTLYANPGVAIHKPADADSLYLRVNDSVSIVQEKPDPENGSNNWAVSGKKTTSGAPILCNDPHLHLSLPSIWFEMQLSTNSFNAYGVSFPGAPGIIIGFNDSIAFGVTNSERDVRDYYQIRFRDASMTEYWYNGKWQPTEFRYEHIGIKGEPEMIDTVAYTVFGPVMYDKKFPSSKTTEEGYYAVRWKAHDPSNEFMTFYGLDHAKNYNDYYEAIGWLHTPGQNCVFASKSGDIAIWAQGEFPAKWRRQGDFIMPGTDSSYAWQGMIPREENPHMINPPRQYVSSANQLPADPALYPYYLGGRFSLYRGYILNRYLNAIPQFSVEDMMKLQTENYNVFAEMAVPLIRKYVDSAQLEEKGRSYLKALHDWDLRYDADETAPTIFELFWKNFTHSVWDDEFHKANMPLSYPEHYTLLEAILRDSNFSFIDNINTPKRETLRDIVNEAFGKTVDEAARAEEEHRLPWARYKATKVGHLLRLDAFSVSNLSVGGGRDCINAVKEDHGPSWRMVVQLSDKTQAYGIYPGGQSGNPGSMYYDNFIEDWAASRYYPLWVMTRDEGGDKRVKATITAGSR